MYIGLYVKYPLFLSDFKRNLEFLNRFFVKTQISNFIKIRPVGVDFFNTDRQTNMTKLVVAFRNFVNTPTNPTIPFSSFLLHAVYQPPCITFVVTYSWYGFGKQATELAIYSPNRHVLATKFHYSYSKPCPGGKYGISYLLNTETSRNLLQSWLISLATDTCKEFQLLELYTCSTNVLRPLCLAPLPEQIPYRIHHRVRSSASYF
jgi:hypothetical protein